MRSVCTIPVRQATIPMLALAGLLAWTAPAGAQGFGIGARMAWVTADTEADIDSVRFIGGQIRFISQRFGVELALDRHSESFELLNQKVTETPLQASIIMRMTSGSVAPFLLGGPGWYHRKVEAIDGPGDLERQHDRIRLACRCRPRDPGRQTLRFPRRLPLYVPRLPRRQGRGIHRWAASGTPGIDVDAGSHRLFLKSGISSQRVVPDPAAFHGQPPSTTPPVSAATAQWDRTVALDRWLTAFGVFE